MSPVTAAVSGDSYVVFRLAGEEYALPVYQVTGIVRYVPPTPVPRSAESVMGVINLRGKVIPLVDLMKRFKDEDFEATAASRILVAEGTHGMVGLAVDSVREVSVLDGDSVSAVPQGVVSSSNADAFIGVVERDGSLVVLLDLDKTLSPQEFTTERDDTEGESHV